MAEAERRPRRATAGKPKSRLDPSAVVLPPQWNSTSEAEEARAETAAAEVVADDDGIVAKGNQVTPQWANTQKQTRAAAKPKRIDTPTHKPDAGAPAAYAKTGDAEAVGFDAMVSAVAADGRLQLDWPQLSKDRALCERRATAIMVNASSRTLCAATPTHPLAAALLIPPAAT